MGDYERRAGELSEFERRSDAEVARQIAELEARLAHARSVDWSRLPTDLSGDFETALLAPDASWNRPPPPPGLCSGSLLSLHPSLIMECEANALSSLR